MEKGRAFQLTIQPVKLKEGKPQFVVDYLSSLIERTGYFSAGLAVQNALLNHRNWSLMPDGDVLVADLTDPKRRIGYWLEQESRLVSADFDLAKIIENPQDVAGAVLLTKPLTQLDQSWLTADMVRIVGLLPQFRGALFLVEAKGQHRELEQGWRKECLKRQGLELVEPNIYSNPGRDFFLWTARRHLEGNQEIWQEVRKYFRAKRAIVDGLGIDVYESSDGGLVIVDWRRHTPIISKVGEVSDDDGLKLIDARVEVELPQLTEKARRLCRVLERKAREEFEDSQKPLLQEGQFRLESLCPNSDYHPSLSIQLTRVVVWHRQERGKLAMTITDCCPHCGIVYDYGDVGVKPHKRLINGQLVHGWVAKGRRWF